MRRVAILAILLGFLVLVRIGFWVFWGSGGEGLVTIDRENAPLREVLDLIEKQAGIEAITDADPEARVTLRVSRYPLMRALSSLASQVGATAYPAYYLAGDDGEIEDAWARFEAGGGDGSGNWLAYYMPMPDFSAMVPGVGAAPPPHRSDWVSPDGGGDSLHEVLRRAAALQPVCFVAPKAYDPVVGEVPESGRVRRAVGRLAKESGGVAREAYVLRMREEAGGVASVPAPRGPQGATHPPAWAQRPGREEIALRREAAESAMGRVVAELDGEQAAAARKHFEMMQQMRERRESPPEGPPGKSPEEREPLDREEMQTVLEQGGSWASQSTPEERKAHYQDYMETKAEKNDTSGSRKPGGAGN